MADRTSRNVSPGLVLTLLTAPFLVWMLVEIGAMIWAAQAIGWWVLAIVIGTAVLGFALLGREGRKSIENLRRAAATGIEPDQRLADAGMVFAGGIMLILPGILADVVGLLFVLPFTRPLLRGAWRSAAGWASRRKAAREAEESPIIPGEVVDDAPTTNDGPLVIEGTVVDVVDGEPDENSR